MFGKNDIYVYYCTYLKFYVFYACLINSSLIFNFISLKNVLQLRPKHRVNFLSFGLYFITKKVINVTINVKKIQPTSNFIMALLISLV